MKTELRFTDTNAASDSKGRTWGLEGGLFWWLVGGIGAGITVFFVLLVMLNTSLLTAFLVALVPVGSASPTSSDCGRASRPATTATFLNTCLTGRGFSPEVRPFLHSSAFMKSEKHIQSSRTSRISPAAVELIPLAPAFIEFIDAHRALGISDPAAGSISS